MSQTKVEAPFVANNANFRNLLINGDMKVAQRSTSTSGVSTTGNFILDRWKCNIDNLGAFTISQSTDVPTGQGFSNSMKWDCTTADASPAAGDNMTFQQRFEGQNLQMLKKGTSSAEKTTLSFWVKSNKTGTYVVELRDKDNSNRLISKTYTISSSDTWEKKIVTFDISSKRKIVLISLKKDIFDRKLNFQIISLREFRDQLLSFPNESILASGSRNNNLYRLLILFGEIHCYKDHNCNHHILHNHRKGPTQQKKHSVQSI